MLKPPKPIDELGTTAINDGSATFDIRGPLVEWQLARKAIFRCAAADLKPEMWDRLAKAEAHLMLLPTEQASARVINILQDVLTEDEDDGEPPTSEAPGVAPCKTES